ncbi:hypothetical protein H4217_007299 [Coemansia sp. RSA 1939]|nr:hypothetical protein H4217_007299 [Coemansia sp. RSA 1939]KAJ2599391.1 hypothetical protein EV177_007340 [Coemansia sp. RSA 1804]
MSSSSPPVPPSAPSYGRARKKESRAQAPRSDRASDAQPAINYHSRSAAREQLRRQTQQGYAAGGVLADINALREQQDRGNAATSTTAAAAHSAFVPSGPLDSLSTSAYVSGHLTPSDQWVAIGNESSSGVISLTSSDAEEEPPDSAVGSNDEYVGRRRSVKGKEVAATAHSNWRDAEFQLPVDANRHQQKPLRQANEFSNYPQPQAITRSTGNANTNIDVSNENGAGRWNPQNFGELDEQQQAVHLLRESVASLLSSAGTSSSVASSSAFSGNPARSSTLGGSRRKGSSRVKSTGSKGGGSVAYRQQSRSPSTLSKISEPCYHPSSEPRRQFTANFDHFSDVALSTTATPSFYAQHRHSQDQSRLHAGSDSGSRRRNTQFPTYEEFKRQQQQQQQQHSNNASSLALRRRTNVDDSVDADTIVPMSPSLGKQKMYSHPLLVDPADGNGLFLSDNSLSLSPTRAAAAAAPGMRSPFASIRTVSPIIVHRPAEFDAEASMIAVQRAQAEAALEQTILCPIKSFNQFGAEYHRPDATRYGDNKEARGPGVQREDGAGELAAGYVQGWARYTSYAIVGFGVGTLFGVGMLYFDMAANATPKATRTIPIAGF